MTDEVLIRLIMLPLTYKGTEKKQTAIKECVRLARGIEIGDTLLEVRK
ncbi:MAG: hypothetical protein HFG71_02110 [Hungatella sp.]|nr:hypothetical protein [Hungatella sp.]